MRYLILLGVFALSAWVIVQAINGSIVAIVILIVFSVITLMIIGAALVLAGSIVTAKSVGTIFDKNARENVHMLSNMVQSLPSVKKSQTHTRMYQIPDDVYVDIE